MMAKLEPEQQENFDKFTAHLQSHLDEAIKQHHEGNVKGASIELAILIDELDEVQAAVLMMSTQLHIRDMQLKKQGVPVEELDIREVSEVVSELGYEYIQGGVKDVSRPVMGVSFNNAHSVEDHKAIAQVWMDANRSFVEMMNEYQDELQAKQDAEDLERMKNDRRYL
jgi:hypothetical protein